MTAHKTQLDIIRTQIDEEGFVARNWCLSRFITRLGARICDLKAEGYEFTAIFEEEIMCIPRRSCRRHGSLQSRCELDF